MQAGTRRTIRRRLLTWLVIATLAISGSFALEHDSRATTPTSTDNATLTAANKPDPPKHHKKCKDDSKKDANQQAKGKPDKDKKGCQDEEASGEV